MFKVILLKNIFWYDVVSWERPMYSSRLRRAVDEDFVYISSYSLHIVIYVLLYRKQGQYVYTYSIINCL